MFVISRSGRLAAVVMAVGLVLTACGSSSSKSVAATGGGATASSASTGLGAVLVDTAGKTLYHFDHESNGKIACASGCTSTWPPYIVTGQPSAGSGVSGTLGVITRPDGGKQLTYNGMPMYRYAGDQKAGDTNGDGIGGVWHATRLSAAAGAPARRPRRPRPPRPAEATGTDLRGHRYGGPP
jgi:predicted lipoprotein with Yx(FWY)xxD motif